MFRLRIKDTAALRSPAEELPLVRDAYLIVLDGQLPRKRIEGRRELQDPHGGLVDFLMPAAAPNDGFQEPAVGPDGHFDHRRAGELPTPHDVGEIHRPHALDLAAPAVQVNGYVGFPRIRGDPELLPRLAAHAQ